MAKAKTKTGPEIKIGEAALRVAARQGWNRLTLDAVAKAAKIPAAQVKKLFPDKNDLLTAIVATVDSHMATAISKPDPESSPHDRLFEILMARLDFLQTHRRAITGIMDAAKRDLRMGRKLLPAQINAMRRILELSWLKPQTPREPFVVAGLLGVYGLTLCVWRNDSSPDMTKTMAALDRFLRRAIGIFDIIFRPQIEPVIHALLCCTKRA